MTMTPLALSLLGVEPQARRRQTERPGESIFADILQAQTQAASELRPTRSSRRATSYYNQFQTSSTSANDDPPSYALATKYRPIELRNVGRETLPQYDCSVSVEGKILLHLESISPLNRAAEGEWREVYMVLRGTLLSFHRPKDSGPGKLLRAYTLQHAEVGLAPDSQHTVLVPQTRLAHLLPSSARRKAWQKDPDLFKPVRQHILRLRVETDQLMLADASEERVHSLIHSLSAAIDISVPVDERSIPRQCTVPRRRRRHRNNQHTGDLSDPILLAEQERILREMYPAFAERTEQNGAPLERTATNTSEEPPADTAQTPAREEDEIDLSAIREDFTSSSQPSGPRHAATSSMNSTYNTEMMYATSSTNFSTSGKWLPPHTRTPQQIHRYVRRCMPILLAESVRASDILICHGKRVKINWRMELLEEWELQPPSYKSHGFDTGPTGHGLERTRSCSQNSASESATQDAQQTGGSVLGGESEDQITPAEDGMANLDLSKVTSVATMDKAAPRESQRQPGPEITGCHGVVFCF